MQLDSGGEAPSGTAASFPASSFRRAAPTLLLLLSLILPTPTRGAVLPVEVDERGEAAFASFDALVEVIEAARREIDAARADEDEDTRLRRFNAANENNFDDVARGDDEQSKRKDDDGDNYYNNNNEYQGPDQGKRKLEEISNDNDDDDDDANAYIVEIAKKIAEMELANARLGGIGRKRGKVDVDKMDSLQKQVDANKAVIERLKETMSQLIVKVCKNDGKNCPKNPWKRPEPPLTTPVAPVVATTETPPKPKVVVTTKAPKPVATKAPKPVATKAPKPVATKAPKPVATKAPKPVATKAPKPVATKAQKPVATKGSATTKKIVTKPPPPKTTTPAPTTKAPSTKPKTTTTTTTTTTARKAADPKGDCGTPDAPANGHTESTKTTLNNVAMDQCNPGYDLMGDNKRICTAIWNDQKGDYDYSWAPPLSVICKPNGKPKTKPKPKPKPKPKTTKKPTAKPTKKPTAKPTENPTTRPTKKPTAKPTKKPTKAPAKRLKKEGKKEEIDEVRQFLVDKRAELEKLIQEENLVEMKRRREFWREHNYSSLPARCLRRPNTGSCKYGYYFDQDEGRCDSLFACQYDYDDPDSNFFRSRRDCKDTCQDISEFQGR